MEDSLDRLTALLASGFKPRSRAALFVDLVSHPDKYEITVESLPVAPVRHEAAARRAEDVRRSAEQAADRSIDALENLPRQQQVEEVMRVLLVMLRGDLKTHEFDALRALLAEDQPLEIKRWVLRECARNNKAGALPGGLPESAAVVMDGAATGPGPPGRRSFSASGASACPTRPRTTQPLIDDCFRSIY